MNLTASTGLSDMTRFAERVWVVESDIDREAIPELCERFAVFVAGSDDEVIVCDVGAIAFPDAACLSALARMQLTARRLGRRIQLHRAQRSLIELILLSGLGGVLPLYTGLRVGGEPAS